GLLGLGGIGAGLALTGLIGGLVASAFALTYGSMLAVLGLVYLVAYINQLGGADLGGYKPALALGAVGALVFVVALLRSVLPHDHPFFVPTGLVLMTLGLAYALTALFLLSDATLI